MNKIILFVFFVLVCKPSIASFDNFLQVRDFTNILFPLWAVGDGDQVSVKTFCIGSANYNNVFINPPPLRTPAAAHKAYEYRVDNRTPAAGYYLHLDTVLTNTGNSRIPVLFEHRDKKEPTGYETLSHAVYDSHSHEGQFKNCANGDNSELRVTVLSSALSESRAGLYRGRFKSRARGGSSGSLVRSKDFLIRIDVAEIVRISHLDTIPLGAWGVGDSNLNLTESFCVYSNNSTGGYNITLSSDNQDVSGNFRLANGDASEYIQYGVSFDDSIGGGGVSAGVLPISGQGSNTSSNCGGGDNANIGIEVLSSNLGPASSGNYSDSLVLLVAPE